ncbi:MAG: diphthamide biosynthesis enzyme Dph2 [Euryarchaeota archaeon]|nr:diphthamide biosynthesis enzyme Dph2 [Euryarchaeota archaeon]
MDFETERIAKLVKETDAQTIVLQFPEGLKRYGPPLALQMERDLGIAVMLSGNPCYGACDLDVTSRADLLFHFGHAPIPRIQVPTAHFIEVRNDTDVIPITQKALSVVEGHHIGLLTTVQHIHKLEEIKRELESQGYRCDIGCGDDRIQYPGQILGCNFSAARAVNVDEYLYIGSGTFHALGVGIATGKRVIVADPFLDRIIIPDTETIIRQRHGFIAKARDARSFGVLIGTKIGQRRSALARELIAEARSHDYDAFAIRVNEVTPWVLYQFPADAYVNTACPRIAIDDASTFRAPMLTPIEFEIVLDKRSLSDYVFDEF